MAGKIKIPYFVTLPRFTLFLGITWLVPFDLLDYMCDVFPFLSRLCMIEEPINTNASQHVNPCHCNSSITWSDFCCASSTLFTHLFIRRRWCISCNVDSLRFTRACHLSIIAYPIRENRRRGAPSEDDSHLKNNFHCHQCMLIRRATWFATPIHFHFTVICSWFSSRCCALFVIVILPRKLMNIFFNNEHEACSWH